MVDTTFQILCQPTFVTHDVVEQNVEQYFRRDENNGLRERDVAGAECRDDDQRDRYKDWVHTCTSSLAVICIVYVLYIFYTEMAKARAFLMGTGRFRKHRDKVLPIFFFFL